MKKDEVKKAFTEAQKEVKEKAIEKLKEFIKRTLEARERQIKVRDEAASKIKILDKDILDLKEGRIDRIEERQKADPKARETSVALVEKVIVKEVHHHHYEDRWYWPYRFIWQIPYVPSVTIIDQAPASIEITSGSAVFNLTTHTIASESFGPTYFTLNNSIAKDHAAGAYSYQVNGDEPKIGYVS